MKSIFPKKTEQNDSVYPRMIPESDRNNFCSEGSLQSEV